MNNSKIQNLLPVANGIQLQSGILATMRLLYSILIHVVRLVLPVIALFSPKMQLFVNGRKKVWDHLEHLDKNKPTVWFHAASLGEYEQAVPVMQAFKNKFPQFQILITFFSPSGYEIKKNNAFAKATTYLPLDTPSNARRFIKIVQPEMVFFVKYEFWPNYLAELNVSDARTFLLSGVFRESQPFFRWYGSWMKKGLNTFEFFFLQDNASVESLYSLGFDNAIMSGDTRFDRVSHQIEVDNSLNFMDRFKKEYPCLVCGSTWSEDENLITSFVNEYKGVVKYVIAPHNINKKNISELESKITVSNIRYSQITDSTDLAQYDVLILDTIGLLSKVYSYGDIAYVGGAVGTTGLHNILEPATFGIPIISGNQISKFPEAIRLRQLAGLYTVVNAQELDTIFTKLLNDQNFRLKTGMISGHFINSNTGATRSVIEYLNRSI